MKVSKAWHLPPDEKGVRSYLPPIDMPMSDSFLNDKKARFIGVSRVERGSLLFFEFESVETAKLLSEGHYFGDEVPVRTERFEVECPAGWSLRSAWLRTSGQ